MTWAAYDDTSVQSQPLLTEGSRNFFNPRCPTVPVTGSPCILEVKWDNFLPDVIRDMVQLGERHGTAYSKYAACRMYD